MPEYHKHKMDRRKPLPKIRELTNLSTKTISRPDEPNMTSFKDFVKQLAEEDMAHQRIEQLGCIADRGWSPD